MKDIYRKRADWKFYLTLSGLAIVAVTLFFSYSISKQLKEIIETNMNIYALAYKELASDTDLNRDMRLPDQLIGMNKSIRMLYVDDQDAILYSANFSPKQKNNPRYLEKSLRRMKNSRFEPIEFNLPGSMQRLYYAPPVQYNLLTYLPLMVLLLLTSYILIGYISFNNSRRAEQNKVWVGMARETAHQLGTPISAILAWIENLKSTELSEEQEMYIEELNEDVSKLDLVADRFSKIGSKPQLECREIVDQLKASVDYMKRRASRNISFLGPEDLSSPCYANINPHLFNWVIENIYRNAIDALDGSGTIQTRIISNDESHHIEISDTGRGIDPKEVKRVFNPGFTTKKRGWGLGLSLAKRIVEEYHGGKIYVKKSKPGMGTTFTIELKKSALKQEGIKI